MIMLLLFGSVQMELIELMLAELVILLRLDRAFPLSRRREIRVIDRHATSRLRLVPRAEG